jgi:hypothetical protein
VVTGALHVAQPAARLTGRLSLGLAPWRRSRMTGLAFPRRRLCERWYESWQPAGERVARIEAAARRAGARIVRGGPYDRWDLEISGGAAGGARMLVAVEEHGRGRQLLRCRVRPTVPGLVVSGITGLAVLAGCAGRAGEWVAALVVAALLGGVVALALWECAVAAAGALAALDESSAYRSESAGARGRALHGLRLLDAALEDA